MADNYIQFSMAIGLHSKEEADWINAHLDFLESVDAEALTKEKLEEHADTALWEDMENLCHFVKQNGMGFSWRIEEEVDQKLSLWIYSDESGNPETVATFLQLFLRKFHPDQGIWFSWAEWCNQLRLNEFCGGAVAITAETIRWFNPIQQKDEFFKSKKLVETNDETNIHIPSKGRV